MTNDENKEEIKHLQWISDRLVNVYNESPHTDFVLKLNEIINKLHSQQKLVPLSNVELNKLFETFQLTTDTLNEEDYPCIPQWNFQSLIKFICHKFGTQRTITESQLTQWLTELSKNKWFFKQGMQPILANKLHELINKGEGQE